MPGPCWALHLHFPLGVYYPHFTDEGTEAKEYEVLAQYHIAGVQTSQSEIRSK